MSDSFGSVISDARLNPCLYAFKQGFGGSDEYECDECAWRNTKVPCRMRQNTDLVRRCRAIARREVMVDED